ncbi:MAG TPA: phosphoribosylformylglycinamidine synthase I [bacterium]|nr:phosphoribosylformylglycinamidine synthase I [bacterium]HQI48122.1 phosphoribosylformylglycinamidine synthase I [bacterium]HQJ64518.1 phosphoribosylformylglycinamidine synthase I [bacterium]
MKPKVLVLRAAGSNCDMETQFAFQYAGAEAELIHINRLLRGEVHLATYQILAIPGGFTYGDDISAGKILANELQFKLAGQLTAFHEAGGLILGICNGFQVLVKAGLLPEVDLGGPQEVTLVHNDSGKFEDRWVHLQVPDSRSLFTAGLSGPIYLPVAHAEGKFAALSPAVLDRLEANRQIVLRYTAADGGPAAYPENPNGSDRDIAGICDSTGRILGLMPHPERHIDPTHHPRWTRNGLAREGDGVALFRNAVAYFS